MQRVDEVGQLILGGLGARGADLADGGEAGVVLVLPIRVGCVRGVDRQNDAEVVLRGGVRSEQTFDQRVDRHVGVHRTAPRWILPGGNIVVEYGKRACIERHEQRKAGDQSGPGMHRLVGAKRGGFHGDVLISEARQASGPERKESCCVGGAQDQPGAHAAAKHIGDRHEGDP